MARVLVLLMLLFSLPAAAGESPAYIGDMGAYTAAEGDTLAQVARAQGLGYLELQAANPGVDPWAPPPGTALTLPTRHLLPDAPREGVVINLAEMRLYAFTGAEPATYPIGIGRAGLETPTGTTRVRAKVEGPTWRPTERMRAEDPELPAVVPPGPDNPLGTHALYLGWAQYAIHGTDKPFGIGRRVSSGCIRLDPRDIPLLYEAVPVGAPVTVVDQAVKAAWIDGVLYAEVAPPARAGVAPAALSRDVLERISALAEKHGATVNWRALRTALREARGHPVPVSL